MNDKELIRALRCCEDGGCNDCRWLDSMECYREVTYRNSADRLEALLAENERLNIELQAMRNAANGFKKMVPKWRPVSDPPKESAIVLSRDIAGVVTTAYYNGRWHGMLNCDAITHWMPLPSTEGVE